MNMIYASIIVICVMPLILFAELFILFIIIEIVEKIRDCVYQINKVDFIEKEESMEEESEELIINS